MRFYVYTLNRTCNRVQSAGHTAIIDQCQVDKSMGMQNLTARPPPCRGRYLTKESAYPLIRRAAGLPERFFSLFREGLDFLCQQLEDFFLLLRHCLLC